MMRWCYRRFLLLKRSPRSEQCSDFLKPTIMDMRQLLVAVVAQEKDLRSSWGQPRG
jgi:hypothetical protein